MIKKITLLLTLTFTIIISIQAQEQVTLKYKTFPNATYKTVMTTITDAKIYFGDDLADTLSSIPPATAMETTSTSIMSLTMNTSSMKEKMIPMVIHYDSMIMLNSFGMGAAPMKKEMLSGTKVYGKLDIKNMMTVDSIIGEMDELTKQSLEEMIPKLTSSITFPEKSMKIGDEFTTTTPMSIPIPGQNPIECNIKTTYLLKEIKDNIGYFDIAQEYEMVSVIQEVNMKLKGTGSGEMEYDIKNQFSKFMETKSALILKINIETLKVTSWSDVTSRVEVELIKE